MSRDWDTRRNCTFKRRFLSICQKIAPLTTVALSLSSSLWAQVNVLTYHNDNARTGQNLAEAFLTPANVQSASFGKLFSVPVDGKVDGQPLYISAINMPGRGVRNVVYAVTEHDSVYTFDADTGTILWQLSLLKSRETTSDTRG